MYGLVSQMRRASSSVAGNIAEGCGRDGNAELAHDLSMVDEEDHAKLDRETTEVKRMLTSLIHRLRSQV